MSKFSDLYGRNKIPRLPSDPANPSAGFAWFNKITNRFMINSRLPFGQDESIATEQTVAEYTMGNIEGSTLIDETGNYDGTITGATPVSSDFGEILSFDGINDYVQAGIPSINGDFSISFWINTQNLNGNMRIFDWRGTGTLGDFKGFQIKAWNSTTDIILLDDGAGNIIELKDSDGLKNYDTGSLEHIVVTWDNTTKTLSAWNNASLDISKTNLSMGPINGPYSAYIGTNCNGQNTQFLNGGLGFLRVHNKVLSESEIVDINKKQAYKIGLLAHYAMNNIEGSTLVDETGNYDGTITGATVIEGPFRYSDALDFDGVNDFVGIPLVLPDGDKTISFWVYTGITDGIFIGEMKDGSHKFFGVISTATSVAVQVENNGSNWSLEITDLNLLDRWAYITAMIDSNRLVAAYLDAVFLGSDTAPSITTTRGPFEINKYNGAYTTGKVGPFKVHNRILSQEEITHEFEISKPKTHEILYDYT